MLDESQLDEFLNEFFGEEEPASDVTRLKNSGKPNPFRRNEVPSEELEEYTLPTDGMIIRQMERQGKVSRRTWFAFAVMLIVVPILLFFSVKIWGGRKYLLCSLIVVVAAMLPFFMMFEGRKPKAREIMVISVLAAIGVAGRAAFFMVPSFKPVAAIVILTGISFGGEAGFLVGSLTMLISNMFMGQGPWTPWQMLAFWHDWISGRDPVPEGDFKSQEVRSLYLRIFKCLFNLWRHYEPCQCPHVLRVHYKKQPDRLLHFRCSGGSGTCSFHRDFPVAA